jgi:ADP-heptose:LPS heptosyltransferase
LSRILVIKLGALGDVVLAFAAMRRIREAHPDAEITALTTAAYGDLIGASPYVDRVEADGRPPGIQATLGMLRRLRRAGYARVYDLQTSSRTDAYFQALRPSPPPWSGTAPGCALPHRNPERDRMHTLERQADQLREAGIWPDAPTAPGSARPPDLSWLINPETLERFGLRRPYALLAPGGSAHRPEKRWPATAYADLADALARQGLQPVVLGGPAEADLAGAMPGAVDLTGRTSFADIASLGSDADLAVGNDTGPSHLLAAVGAPLLTLFSGASDPALTAPRGPRAQVLQRAALADLTVQEVLRTLGVAPADA